MQQVLFTIKGCSINFRRGPRGRAKTSLRPEDRQLRYDQDIRSIMSIHETEILSANWLTAQHCHRGIPADNVVNSAKRCGENSFKVELEDSEEF